MWQGRVAAVYVAGGLLMDDGSIGKEEGAPAAPHTLHVVKETGENELVLDRVWRKLKDSV